MSKFKSELTEEDQQDIELMARYIMRIEKLRNRNCIFKELIEENKDLIETLQNCIAISKRRLKRPYFNMNEFLEKHGLNQNNLEKLVKREIRVLEFRIAAVSLERIGEMEDITRERARQIEVEALRKLGIYQKYFLQGRYRSPFK